jgi:bifunctional NMN adenylyltransferase/nudix hydrolase
MTGVIIGRFQPLHYGHCYLIDSALKKSNLNVVILLGSINQPRTYKNPYTFEERADMIISTYPMLRCIGINDYPGDDEKWRSEIKGHLKLYDDITLYGYLKDKSSYYLNIFPEYNVELINVNLIISATSIREYIKERQFGVVRTMVPGPVYEKIKHYNGLKEG